jgi:hypothetical protein
VYDFRSAFEPFLNPAIKGAQLPFMMKFERVEGVATMQYKLFSPHTTWLPKTPTVRLIEDGHLPTVNDIEREPFEWVGGVHNMLHISDDASVSLLTAGVDIKEKSLALDKYEDMFAEVAAETAADMLARFAREEDGIFRLQKRMQLPHNVRNKDFLTRRNTANEGYIVWLQDTEEGSWIDVKPQAIVPVDIETGSEAQDGISKRMRSAAKDIDSSAKQMLSMVCD